MNINLNISPLKTWNLRCTKPVIISGPCSLESEAQTLKTAHELDIIKEVSVFRGGVWKPRTRPNSFEGVGSIGLQWLKKVKLETSLKVAVEVANVQHIEEAINAGIDILWIGARTAANPFSVQEIADTLKGVDIPVMVKNPINPDLDLWIGALERLNNCGITKLMAIHRGFSFYHKTIYRNDPAWEIPIDLMRAVPTLPIICDPSHIAGKRSLLQTVAQEAFDLEMLGIIIESHYDPDNAKSDKEQQITPLALKSLLANIVLREMGVNGSINRNNLTKLRKSIDELDINLLKILSTRKSLVEEIGKFKKKNNITILQLNRWDEIMHTRIESGKKLALKKEFVRLLFQLLHEDAINIQTSIFKDSNNQ